MIASNVVIAAAGSGKTTRLVVEYLRLLATGIPADQIIAITFTRAAGAELVDRVGAALRAGLGDQVALADLADAWPEYAKALPTDDATSRRALRALGAAPVGTTDSFVQSLLAEFALDAALPLSSGQSIPLDRLAQSGASCADAFDAAARSLIDPANGAIPPEATRCLERMTLGALLTQVGRLAAAPPGAWITGEELRVKADELALLAARQVAEAGVSFNSAAAGREDQELARAWLMGARTETAPPGLLAYVANRLDATAKDSEALRSALAGAAVDVGVCRVGGDAFVKPFTSDRIEGLGAADVLRADLIQLARLTRDEGLRLVASAGGLDYDMMCDVAIRLCEKAPARLRSRFQALLVDEAQDANPKQMALYEALSVLPGEGRRLATTYVGDPRQSIYLFRGAEPRVFEDCVAQATAAGTLDSLNQNYRSSLSLVAAHRALFDAAAGTSDSPRLPGVLSLAGVRSVEKNAELELNTAWRAPVVIVPGQLASGTGEQKVRAWKPGDVDAAAVELFAERVLGAWAHAQAEEPAKKSQTAAVLATSWGRAIIARDRLRVPVPGRPAIEAFLDGSRDLLGTRTAADVRVLVRALWSSADRIAWAALWKLPCVGLTDAGLALLAAGEGVLPGEAADDDEQPVLGGLSGPVYGGRLDPNVYGGSDVLAFARAQPVLRDALNRIGRAPTAEVIENVATRLRLRALLRVGPDGADAVGQLEVILDWVRQAERDGVDPDAVISLLDPEGLEGGDVPRLSLTRPARSIACTTVFQAKGLAWDHVCVVGGGAIGRSATGDEWVRGRVQWEGSERALVGVKLDMSGGLDPAADIVSALGGAVSRVRADEERLRVVYVAITRARRSVTLGLLRKGGSGIQGKLAEAWLGTESALHGVEIVERPLAPDVAASPQQSVEALAAFGVEPASPTGWRLVSPSSDAASRKRDAVEAASSAVVGRVKSFVVGTAAVAYPDAINALRGDGAGTLLHAWMAAGGFVGGVGAEEASALLAEWSVPVSQELVDWLGHKSTQVRAKLPSIHALLTGPGVRLVFEAPLVGVVSDADAQRLYSGSIDMLAVLPDGRIWIVDFKGQTSPATAVDLANDSTFRGYVLQVEAYRRSIEAAGYTVAGCGLLFLGTMTWVEW